MPNEFFDGFPYELTRVSPSLYHLLVLPSELPFGHLKEIVRWQAEANTFPWAARGHEGSPIPKSPYIPVPGGPRRSPGDRYQSARASAQSFLLRPPPVPALKARAPAGTTVARPQPPHLPARHPFPNALPRPHSPRSSLPAAPATFPRQVPGSGPPTAPPPHRRPRHQESAGTRSGYRYHVAAHEGQRPMSGFGIPMSGRRRVLRGHPTSLTAAATGT